MIRDAIGRIRRSVPVLAAIILSTTVAVGVIAMPVQATGGSADEQRRVNEIINDAIDDFPVDDLLKEAIAETGENDEQGFTAIVNGVVYEVTTRYGFEA